MMQNLRINITLVLLGCPLSGNVNLTEIGKTMQNKKKNHKKKLLKFEGFVI